MVQVVNEVQVVRVARVVRVVQVVRCSILFEQNPQQELLQTGLKGVTTN